MKVAIQLGIVLTVLFAAVPCAFANSVYEQHKDVVYGDTHGIGLLMDIFVPNGDKNGLGIVDVASGAWHSDRGKIRDHQRAQLFDILCAKGYTVFAVRPGSRTKFTGLEMLAHVNRGIRWVKANADEYGIDPERLGIIGASAGAHLAALAVLNPLPADPDANDSLDREDTKVAAAALFFPPTNFLVWGDEPAPYHELGTFLFADGINGRSDDEVEARARELSPVFQVNGTTPPVIIWHGDADPTVPLQQSEELAAKLKEAGTDVEFHIKPGGGHPWFTIHEEVAHISDWFDKKLGS